MADLDKTFQLKIIGDITAYQAEMAKIPGVTEKQAAAAALRMEREMVKAARATGAAAQQAASGGADALGKSFGQAKEQVALVAAGASKISPELGAAVNTASSVLGVLKSMASPVGAVTAAVTLGAAAWVKFSGDVDKAIDRQNDAAKAAIKAQLGIVDSGNFLNKALEAQDKVSLLERKNQWIAFAKDYVEIFSLGGLNPIANAGLAKIRELEAAQAGLIANAKALRDRNIELAQAQKDQAEAEIKHAKVTKANNKETKAANDAEIDYLQTIADIKVEGQDEVAKATEQATDAQVDAANAVSDVEESSAEGEMDMAFQVADAFAGAADAMFGDTKAGALAGAIVNTALAATKSLTSAPFPANVALAAATVAAGAAQIQKIQSTNIAHSGLAYEAPGGSAPDESVWMRRRGERMLTERGAQAVGGDSQIRRLNAGQSPSMGGKFVGITQFKHKMLDATIGPNIARPAAARTEIKAIAQTGGRVGHRLRSTT